MTKDKHGHPRGVALCGRYATKVLEATVLERLRLLVQLRVALWRLHWTSLVASPGDDYRVSSVEHNEMRAAEA